MLLAAFTYSYVQVSGCHFINVLSVLITLLLLFNIVFIFNLVIGCKNLKTLETVLVCFYQSWTMLPMTIWRNQSEDINYWSLSRLKENFFFNTIISCFKVIFMERNSQIVTSWICQIGFYTHVYPANIPVFHWIVSTCLTSIHFITGRLLTGRICSTPWGCLKQLPHLHRNESTVNHGS